MSRARSRTLRGRGLARNGTNKVGVNLEEKDFARSTRANPERGRRFVDVKATVRQDSDPVAIGQLPQVKVLIESDRGPQTHRSVPLADLLQTIVSQENAKLGKRFDKVDAKLTEVQEKQERLNDRVEGVDTKVEGLEQRQTKMEEDATIE